MEDGALGTLRMPQPSRWPLCIEAVLNAVQCNAVLVAHQQVALKHERMFRRCGLFTKFTCRSCEGSITGIDRDSTRKFCKDVDW